MIEKHEVNVLALFYFYATAEKTNDIQCIQIEHCLVYKANEFRHTIENYNRSNAFIT